MACIRPPLRRGRPEGCHWPVGVRGPRPSEPRESSEASSVRAFPSSPSRLAKPKPLRCKRTNTPSGDQTCLHNGHFARPVDPATVVGARSHGDLGESCASARADPPTPSRRRSRRPRRRRLSRRGAAQGRWCIRDSCRLPRDRPLRSHARRIGPSAYAAVTRGLIACEAAVIRHRITVSQGPLAYGWENRFVALRALTRTSLQHLIRPASIRHSARSRAAAPTGCPRRDRAATGQLRACCGQARPARGGRPSV